MGGHHMPMAPIGIVNQDLREQCQNLKGKLSK